MAMPSVSSTSASGLRTYALVCYALYLLGCVNGFTTLVGLVLAYVKRRDAAGTVWASHFDNLILAFWVFLLVSIIAWLTYVILVGFVLFGVGWLWYLYRTLRGTIRAVQDRPF